MLDWVRLLLKQKWGQTKYVNISLFTQVFINDIICNENCYIKLGKNAKQEHSRSQVLNSTVQAKNYTKNGYLFSVVFLSIIDAEIF